MGMGHLWLKWVGHLWLKWVGHLKLLLQREADVNHQKEVRPLLMVVGVFLHEEWLL